jgi:glucose-1-phosphate adenylyltransferase
MHRTLALVLAGGEGRRLAPLTRERSKPAVYFGGSYRLIDFVLSNLVNSGVRYIKVVTQYRATSLVRHLARNWPTTTSSMGHEIDLVPAAMNHGPNWFRGTADAIWQNLDVLREQRPDDVLIFGSDHIYKMDVSLMVEDHRAMGSDVSVAVLPMPRSEASAFGCVRVDGDGYVTGFLEKPKDPPAMPGHPELSLISMGNYVFKTPALLDELKRCMGRESQSYDFGKDILATAHHRLKVRAYDFRQQLCPGESERSRGYWRDVGTLDAYYEASMDLVTVEPHLNLYNPGWPIRGAQPTCGPAKFVFSDDAHSRVGSARDSIVGAGAILSGARLERSIAFEQVRLHSYSEVLDSVLFPGAQVGRHCHLERCIVDREVKVPPGTIVGVDTEDDRRRGFAVSEGGVIVLTRADFGQVDEFDVGGPVAEAEAAAHG